MFAFSSPIYILQIILYFVVWNTAFNTICSKCNIQSCTTLYCYSTQFLATQSIRPYTWNGLQYKLKTFCHQTKRGWYAFVRSFVLITKNIWCFRRLWIFLMRKINHYKCMLCVTSKYIKTAWDIFIYSMEQNLSSDANWSSASQEIFWILWKQEFHYHFHKYLPSVPNLSCHAMFISWGAVVTLPNLQPGGILVVCCP